MRCWRSRSTGGVEGWRVDLDRLAGRRRPHRRRDPREVSRPRHPLPRPLAALRRRRRRVCPRATRPSAPAPPSTSSSSRCCSTPAPAPAGASPIRSAASTFTRSEGLAVASQRMFEAGRARTISRSRSTAETLARGLPGERATIRCSASKAAPPCSAGSARRCWRGPTCSRRDGPTRRPVRRPRRPRRRWPPAGPGDPRSCCSKRSARSGRDRLIIDGVPLGDCWRHPAIRRDDATDGLVPLHKLSQWLAYSLIEPLAGRPASRSSTWTASPASPNIATAACSWTWACSRSPIRPTPARTHHVSDPADRRLARHDRRPARPDGAAGPRPARRRRGGLPARPHARGRQLGRRPPHRRRDAARAAARPSTSSATAPCSDAKA